MSWSNVAISAAVIGITFVITFLMAKPIGAYQLGEAYAQSMGVNIKVFRIALILLSVFSPHASPHLPVRFRLSALPSRSSLNRASAHRVRSS